MKTQLIISLYLASVALGDPTIELQKPRGLNNAPSPHLNSITSNQEVSKAPPSNAPQNSTPHQPLQQQQQQHHHAQHQNGAVNNQPRQAIQPSYQLPTQQAHSSIFTHVESGNQFQPTSGYLLTVNPNQQPGNVAGGGQTPLIMSYIPQGHNPNGVQYIQLVARPVMVPYQQYVPQLAPQQLLPSVPQSSSNSVTAPVYGQSNSQQSNSQTQQQPQTFPNFNALPIPVNAPVFSGYQGHPALSGQFYGPQSRVYTSSAPDLSLNTNEYMPPQSEGGFRAIKPQQRP